MSPEEIVRAEMAAWGRNDVDEVMSYFAENLTLHAGHYAPVSGHDAISRMRAAGIAADVVAAWHGHTERMTQAVYGRVTDDRLTAASAVFSAAVGQS